MTKKDGSTLLVVHYTGHRIAGTDVQTPFHEECESAVAYRVAQELFALDGSLLAAVGSLAAGADILFAEAFLRRSVPLHVVLPFTTEAFRAQSVTPSSLHWIARFDRVLVAAASVRVLAGAAGSDAAYAACTQAAIELTLETAQRLGASALQLAVWDGGRTQRAAGTAADVAAWQSRGLPTRVIPPYS
jgi:hypothetical protein